MADAAALGSSPRLRGTQLIGQRAEHAGRIIPAPAGNTSTDLRITGEPSDHPRACGEHSVSTGSVMREAGSSPRLRGTPILQIVTPKGGRIIPAPAGNTPPIPPPASHKPDHPRACGEHGLGLQSRTSLGGSSPRLRGTLNNGIAQLNDGRIIPAPAGNTFRVRRKPPFSPDHPRACGEHEGRKLPQFSDVGSSPRLRGTPRRGRPNVVPVRIIPAPAGNTTPPGRASLPAADHPRACGEHRHVTQSPTSKIGSSPRLRGTREDVPRYAGILRIIPAPAGNTADRHWTRWQAPDHPRACGEHQDWKCLFGSGFGSSPRLRGTHSRKVGDFQQCRIIPAPAGNTEPASHGGRGLSDHPRACGEHAGATDVRVPIFGSSPRLRGTPGNRFRTGRRDRIIPAPAGNTEARRWVL